MQKIIPVILQQIDQKFKQNKLLVCQLLAFVRKNTIKMAEFLNLEHTRIRVVENIEHEPILSHRCKMNDVKDMTIRVLPKHEPKGKEKSKLTNQELLLNLSYHENILNAYVTCASFRKDEREEKYAVFENYDVSLHIGSVLKDFKEFARQVCNGLHHYHRSGIVFDSIITSNIVRSWVRVSDSILKPRYKLTNNMQSMKYANCNANLVAENICDLGEVFSIIHENIKNNNKNGNYLSVHDSRCAADLIQLMKKSKKLQNKSYNLMESYLKHVFFWSIHESFMFLVGIVKKFEPLKKDRFYIRDEIFELCEAEILGKIDKDETLEEKLKKNPKNWHPKASEIVDLYVRFNMSRPGKESDPQAFCDQYKPNERLFALLQIIRNLVSTELCAVENLTEQYFFFVVLAFKRHRSLRKINVKAYSFHRFVTTRLNLQTLSGGKERKEFMTT